MTLNKQKIGLTLFWLGLALAVSMGVVASWSLSPIFRNLSMDGVNQTIWHIPGFLFFLWAFAVPFGALFSGVGVLLYGGAKQSRAWLFGIGIFFVLVLINAIPSNWYFPPLFGIGGILILLSFFAIIWFWAKERKNFSAQLKIVADLRLTAYVFLIIAMWFLCGQLSMPFMKAFEGDISSPLPIMFYLVIAWFFLLLSHYILNKLNKKYDY